MSMYARNRAERVLSIRATPQPRFEAAERDVGQNREQRYQEGAVEDEPEFAAAPVFWTVG
jgi:hypothetical protein